MPAGWGASRVETMPSCGDAKLTPLTQYDGRTLRSGLPPSLLLASPGLRALMWASLRWLTVRVTAMRNAWRAGVAEGDVLP